MQSTHAQMPAAPGAVERRGEERCESGFAVVLQLALRLARGPRRGLHGTEPIAA